MTNRSVLYSFRRCPYAMRARMALLISGECFELREVSLREKPAEMLVSQLKATVPVFITPDGAVIDESMEIMRWALRCNDPECWLDGDDANLIDQIDNEFKHHLDRYKYADRNCTSAIAHRDACLNILTAVDARLALTPYLNGKPRSLTDIAIMPFVRQFAGIDRNWFDAQAIRPLQNWLSLVVDSSLFSETMVRMERWTGPA